MSCKVTSPAKSAWLSPAHRNDFAPGSPVDFLHCMPHYSHHSTMAGRCDYRSNSPPGLELSKFKDRLYSSVDGSKYKIDTQQNEWIYTNYFLTLVKKKKKRNLWSFCFSNIYTQTLRGCFQTMPPSISWLHSFSFKVLSLLTLFMMKSDNNNTNLSSWWLGRF
jgi:hypothetical protein